MLNFSKSKYTSFKKCEKLCWLQKYKPEERVIEPATAARLASGNEVGDLAKSLFGNYVETTVCKSDGSLDLSAMIDKTKRLVSSGTENICEAAFSYNGLYCAVDILHRENGGYAIYEVKSSTSMHDYYYADVAYQKYVLEKCGIKVSGAHVVILNKEYVRNGELDIHKLFIIDGGKDISSQIAEESAGIAENLKRAETVMTSKIEPPVCIGKQCSKGCDFWKYCSVDVPKPSVLDLYRFGEKWNCYNNGIVTFEDLKTHNVALNSVQVRQIEYALEDKGTYVDKANVRAFLSTLTYPLYFLDFETMQLAAPAYDGTKPYEQIPFQYSLHYIEREGGEVRHKEFLAESGDPRRQLAERLCADIPNGACTLAYNASTECGIIARLAEFLPDLSARLLNIRTGIKDLLPVFQKGYYYNRAMGGSFSVKSVLPAVFPDMDYHNLDGVQNGIEAMYIYPKIKDMPPEEARKTREALLKYCERDTLAMVKLLEELIKSSR